MYLPIYPPMHPPTDGPTHLPTYLPNNMYLSTYVIQKERIYMYNIFNAVLILLLVFKEEK